MTDSKLQELLKAAGEETDAEQDQIATLEAKLEAERDARKEERFGWILVSIILVDMVVFDNMTSWAGPIAILVLQIILILALARRLGVDDVAVWIDKILAFSKNNQ